MELFISWSGNRSRIIAEALRGWLPKVIQSLKPWMSDEDINAGARWLMDVSSSLNSMKLGIICVTPENQNNPWLLFEAGALSKTLEQTCVCPLVFEMTPGQLSGPLTQFQANELTKDGITKILCTINKSLGDKQIEARGLSEIIDVWWPKLNETIKSIPAATTPHMTRTTGDQMEELLSLAREQLRRENIRLEASQERDEKLAQMLSFIEHFKGTLGPMISSTNNSSKAMQKILTRLKLGDANGTEGVDIDEATKLMISNASLPTNIDISQMTAMAKMMQEMQEKDKERTESMLAFKLPEVDDEPEK